MRHSYRRRSRLLTWPALAFPCGRRLCLVSESRGPFPRLVSASSAYHATIAPVIEADATTIGSPKTRAGTSWCLRGRALDQGCIR